MSHDDWHCTNCGGTGMRMIRSEDPADKYLYMRCADCGGSGWYGPTQHSVRLSYEV